MNTTFIKRLSLSLLPLLVALFFAAPALARPVAVAPAQTGDHAAAAHKGGGEASLVLPDVGSVKFFGGSVDGRTLLYSGLVVSLLGMGFGFWIYAGLKKAQVHRSMLESSELIYTTCKAYMIQ